MIFSSIIPLRAHDLIKNSSVTGVCYAGKKISRFYIPPPKEYFDKVGSKNGASIIVFYASGFPTLAKTAVENAASILRTLLPAYTKFTINASWEKISTAGVLAQ